MRKDFIILKVRIASKAGIKTELLAAATLFSKVASTGKAQLNRQIQITFTFFIDMVILFLFMYYSFVKVAPAGSVLDSASLCVLNWFSGYFPLSLS